MYITRGYDDKGLLALRKKIINQKGKPIDEKTWWQTTGKYLYPSPFYDYDLDCKSRDFEDYVKCYAFWVERNVIEKKIKKLNIDLITTIIHLMSYTKSKPNIIIDNIELSNGKKYTISKEPIVNDLSKDDSGFKVTFSCSDGRNFCIEIMKKLNVRDEHIINISLVYFKCDKEKQEIFSQTPPFSCSWILGREYDYDYYDLLFELRRPDRLYNKLSYTYDSVKKLDVYKIDKILSEHNIDNIQFDREDELKFLIQHLKEYVRKMLLEMKADKNSQDVDKINNLLVSFSTEELMVEKKELEERIYEITPYVPKHEHLINKILSENNIELEDIKDNSLDETQSLRKYIRSVLLGLKVDKNPQDVDKKNSEYLANFSTEELLAKKEELKKRIHALPPEKDDRTKGYYEKLQDVKKKLYDNVIYILDDVIDYKEIKAILKLFNYSPMEEHIEIDQIKIGKKNYKITKGPTYSLFKDIDGVFITIACSDGRKFKFTIKQGHRHNNEDDKTLFIPVIYLEYYWPNDYEKKLILCTKVENLDWNNLFSKIAFDFSDAKFICKDPKYFASEIFYISDFLDQKKGTRGTLNIETAHEVYNMLPLINKINFEKKEIEILKEYVSKYMKEWKQVALSKKIEKLLLKYFNINGLEQDLGLFESMKDLIPKLSLDQMHKLEETIDLLLAKEKNLDEFSNSEEMEALRKNVRLLKK